MSAYTMLADQSQLAAPAFTTADAVTADPSFDTTNAFTRDFMGFGLTAEEEPVWNMSPISPSFAEWNAKSDVSFIPAAALERDFKHAQVRNGQPTPPLDEQRPSLSGDIMAVFDNQNNWDDTPTPPSSGSRARNSSADNSAAGGMHTDGSKRRRLREHKLSIASTISSGGDSEENFGQDHVKREKFLERNRLAASKCRQKKKEHTMLLESRFKEQSDKRERLNSEISRLRSEILGLKNEVLRHAQCGDEPIKLHLAQMVKQIAKRDRDAPTPDSSEHMSDKTTPPMRGPVSFGFEESLPLESATSLEHQIRRDSEASIALSCEDDFDDLINC